MNKIRFTAFLLLSLLFTDCSNKPQEIIVCGDDMVLIIDKANSDSSDVIITWQWKVSDATDLPEAYQKFMIPTDECKPVDNNSKVLITSSGGGVVLIDRATKKTLFHAHVPNAHSAEILPDNRLVVALSTADGGNCIKLFNLSKPEEVIFKDSIYSGHGAVWMKAAERLFVLGFDELRSYSLKEWDSDKPELKMEKSWKLPDESGHDLSRVSDNKLAISTHRNVWIFNILSENFTTFDLLEDMENVKSVNYDSVTGELIFTKGEISWWTHNIYCRNPDKTIILPDINLYKARVLSR